MHLALVLEADGREDVHERNLGSLSDVKACAVCVGVVAEVADEEEFRLGIVRREEGRGDVDVENAVVDSVGLGDRHDICREGSCKKAVSDSGPTVAA